MEVLLNPKLSLSLSLSPPPPLPPSLSPSLSPSLPPSLSPPRQEGDNGKVLKMYMRNGSIDKGVFKFTGHFGGMP